MTYAPDGLTRCAECSELIMPDTDAHSVHEDTCPEDDWCTCETTYVHPACCRSCRVPVIPGQVEAFPDVPMASTAQLPKIAHP